MDPRLLLRIARWARRPPSVRPAAVVFAALAVVAVLAGIEALWGWPEALTVEPRGTRLPRP